MNQYLIFTNYDLCDLQQEAVKGNPGHPFKTEVTTQRRWSFIAKEQTLLMAMLLILSNEKNDFFWDHLKLYEQLILSNISKYWRDPSDENKSVNPINTRKGGDRKAMESKQVVVKTPSWEGDKFCLSQEGFLKDEGFFLFMDLNTLQRKDGCDRLPKTL